MQGAAYGYTKRLGYHPLVATRAGTGEILFSRMRKGSAGSSRGIIGFVNELVANLRRTDVTGPVTVRADSGFWSWELVDRLNVHGITLLRFPARWPWATALNTVLNALPALPAPSR